MLTSRSDRCRGVASVLVGLGVISLLGAVSCAERKAALSQVAVRGTDYTFDLVDTLPPGPTSFSFENAGQVPHEMILVRLKAGVTLKQVLDGIGAGRDPEEFTEGGVAILIAPPGDSAATRLRADLLPGRTCALVCNFQNTEAEPPHAALGMVKSIEIAAR